MGKPIRHLFFDLDRTLWDFDRNSEESLIELYHDFRLVEKGIRNVEVFLEKYYMHNHYFWSEFRKGNIDALSLKSTRFQYTLSDFGIDDQFLSMKLSEDYLDKLPGKGNLITDTLEILDYLKNRYSLHIITNGFKEVQHRKMKVSGIHHYFEVILTAEEAGTAKPDKLIFEKALEQASALAGESVYVGDHFESDMVGARNAGMQTVFYNPEEEEHEVEVTHEIRKLMELKDCF